GIVDGKEGLQEIKAVPGDCVRNRAERRRLARRGGPAPASVAAGRMQLHDIARIATLEGPLSLDLATRHNALPMLKITEVKLIKFSRKERPMSRCTCQEVLTPPPRRHSPIFTHRHGRPWESGIVALWTVPNL